MICHALAGFGLSFLQDPLSQCPAVTELFHFCLFTPLRGRVRPHRNETVKFADKIQASHLPNHPAETPLFAVFLYPWKQKPLQTARFLKFMGSKLHVLLHFYSVFMHCNAEAAANSDVFELAVAQNTAFHSVFEPAVKKHRNLRRFQRHGRQKHCYLRGFLHFCAKPSNIGNAQAQQNPENHRSNRPEMTKFAAVHSVL